MALNGLQVFGFILGVLAWAGMIGTCASPEWRKNSHGQTLIDNTVRYDGLWMRCKAFATGQTHCDDYNAFFIGLPGHLQVCRGLILSSIALGFIAIIVTVFGLKCVTIGGGNPRIKARVALVGGLLFGMAGILTGAAVSYYAHGVVQEYYNPVLSQDLPMQLRFEYGYALFIGWGTLVAGLLCAIVLCITSALILGRRRSESTVHLHDLRPISILQKAPLPNNQAAIQHYQGAPQPVPPQRQVRIHHSADARKLGPGQTNGTSRSYQNSFASSSGKSAQDDDRRRRRRYSSERSGPRARNGDKTATDSKRRRPSIEEDPPRGLVRSVSGSLKQYL